MSATTRGAGQDAVIPVVLCIDVEPDARHIDLAAPSPWDGFPATVDLLEPIRDAASARSGRATCLNWFVRMDPQVERGYGSLAWIVEQRAAVLERLRASGDHFGLHAHACRWDASRHDWVIDYADHEWLQGCLTEAFEAFAASLARRCTTFRFGDHWMDQSTFAHLERLGMEVDLTPEPGHDDASFYSSREPVVGQLANYLGVPARPYRASADDFRRPDPARRDGAWVLPITTARVRPRLVQRLYRRLRGRHWGEMSTALVSHDPSLFASLVDQALGRSEPHLVLTLRSSAAVKGYAARVATNLRALLARPEASRFTWVDPQQAVALVGATR